MSNIVQVVVRLGRIANLTAPHILSFELMYETRN